MADIGNIKLELLRPGPAHNQLLSPLTPYIALVGREGPVTVQIPFEHRQLLNRLERLRYLLPRAPFPHHKREAEVREMGELLGDILGKVPALLSEMGIAQAQGKGLVHLRLSMSAFELALVPFGVRHRPERLSRVRVSLFLQSRTPITLTREARHGRPLPVKWDRAPRILFAFASPEGLAPVPAQDHLEALRRAVEPWVKWQPNPDDRLKEVKSLITVLPGATLDAIRDACESTEFSHVHILAHGDHLPHNDDRYGVALCDENDVSKKRVVDGESLAFALTSTDLEGSARSRPTLLSTGHLRFGQHRHRPHAWWKHCARASQYRYPLVIASQFPLWMRASSIATEMLYSGLMRGDDPRWSALHHASAPADEFARYS
ncbi:MAG: CHAT domain-containing protein [Desulfobacterales bacterium]|nr:CHAT domain-containing protein [Desulfobacterales bacterium]